MPPDEDLLRELRYCAASPGARFAGGQIGRAQDRGLEGGWLEEWPAAPGLLRVTQAGHRLIARHQGAGNADIARITRPRADEAAPPLSRPAP